MSKEGRHDPAAIKAAVESLMADLAFDLENQLSGSVTRYEPLRRRLNESEHELRRAAAG